MPPYDQRLANEAAAIDQCLKLGGVLLSPRPKVTGFADTTPPPPAAHPSVLAVPGESGTGASGDGAES